jgi:mono/diheme cytochrome c family protein
MVVRLSDLRRNARSLFRSRSFSRSLSRSLSFGAPVAGVVCLMAAQMVPAAPPTSRQAWVAAKGVPAAYKAKANPLKADAATVARGRALYVKYCAKCHGATGKGDGEHGAYYDPPPSDLTALAGWRGFTDAYIYWAIAEGAPAIGKTGMPPLKDQLKANDLWAIVIFVQKAFSKK